MVVVVDVDVVVVGAATAMVVVGAVVVVVSSAFDPQATNSRDRTVTTGSIRFIGWGPLVGQLLG